jgi:hypothetical protein
MAWHIKGSYYAPCSCKIACPCLFGDLDGDNGWCSGVLGFQVDSGAVDGTDVSGAKVVLHGEWPRGFLAGNGKGVAYFDPSLSDEQVGKLGELFSGQKGGVFEVLSTLITDMGPPKRAAISFDKSGDDISLKVEGVGQIDMTPLRGPDGHHTKVLHGAAAFRDETLMGRSSGNAWRDPGLREWTPGGHAEWAEVDWSG